MPAGKITVPRDRFFVAHRDDAAQTPRVLLANEKVLWNGSLSLRGGLPTGTILSVVWSIFMMLFGVIVLVLKRSNSSGPISGDDQRVFSVAAIVALLVGGLVLHSLIRAYRGTIFTITDQRLIEVRYSEIVAYPIAQIKGLKIKLRDQHDGILKIYFGESERMDCDTDIDNLEWPTRDAEGAFHLISELRKIASAR